MLEISLTHLEAPGKPSRLAFQLLSPTSLQVNWGEPTYCNGEILAYCVEYHTIDENSGIEPVVLPLPGPDHRSLLVENLIENTEYRYQYNHYSTVNILY